MTPLPEAIVAPCSVPSDFFGPEVRTQGAVEVAVGRMGDALLSCGAEKAALIDWAGGVISKLEGVR